MRRPSRRSTPFAPVTYSNTAVVLDSGFVSTLGLEPLTSEFLATEGINSYLELQSAALERLPAWLLTFRDWVLRVKPNIVCLGPDTVLDSLLFSDLIAPQAYGFGTPTHVPALMKPNGSLNWFHFEEKTFPSPFRGFYPLRRDGLACHSGPASHPCPQFPGSEPAINFGRSKHQAFHDLRAEARRRLDAASSILLLSLDPQRLLPSDGDLIKGLAPARRLTLVSPAPAVASKIRDVCDLSAFVEVELGSLDSWVTNRLAQWSSV